jgi:hypothetical protein
MATMIFLTCRRVDLKKPPTMKEFMTSILKIGGYINEKIARKNSGTVPGSLPEVDKLLFATALYHNLSVVTADRQLGKAIEAVSLNVADMATLLRELVQNKNYLDRRAKPSWPSRRREWI